MKDTTEAKFVTPADITSDAPTTQASFLQKFQTFFTKQGTCEFDPSNVLMEDNINCTLKLIFKWIMIASGLITIVGFIVLIIIFLAILNPDLIVAGYIATVTIFAFVIFFIVGLLGYLATRLSKTNGWKWGIGLAGSLLIIFIVWEIIQHLPV